MAFVQFTRPDGSSVAVNSQEVVTCIPVPGDGPLPAGEGTRINFRNGTHQDVKEKLAEVTRKLGSGDA